jgi:hypothetical protein
MENLNGMEVKKTVSVEQISEALLVSFTRLITKIILRSWRSSA